MKFRFACLFIKEFAVVALYKSLEEHLVELAEIVSKKLLDSGNLALMILRFRTVFALKCTNGLLRDVEHHPAVKQLRKTLASHAYKESRILEIGCSDPAFDERAFGEFAAYLDTIVTDHIPQPYRKDGKEKGV